MAELRTLTYVIKMDTAEGKVKANDFKVTLKTMSKDTEKTTQALDKLTNAIGKKYGVSAKAFIDETLLVKNATKDTAREVNRAERSFNALSKEYTHLASKVGKNAQQQEKMNALHRLGAGATLTQKKEVVQLAATHYKNAQAQELSAIASKNLAASIARSTANANKAKSNYAQLSNEYKHLTARTGKTALQQEKMNALHRLGANATLSQKKGIIQLVNAQQLQVSASGQTQKSMRGLRGQAQNLGWQFQDVAVQAQMGTDALVIIGQQGSQLASGFGAMGALIGAGIAVGAGALGVLMKAMGSTKKEAKELKTEVKELSDRITELRSGGKTSAIDQALQSTEAKEQLKETNKALAKSIKLMAAAAIVANELENLSARTGTSRPKQKKQREEEAKELALLIKAHSKLSDDRVSQQAIIDGLTKENQAANKTIQESVEALKLEIQFFGQAATAIENYKLAKDLGEGDQGNLDELKALQAVLVEKEKNKKASDEAAKALKKSQSELAAYIVQIEQEKNAIGKTSEELNALTAARKTSDTETQKEIITTLNKIDSLNKSVEADKEAAKAAKALLDQNEKLVESLTKKAFESGKGQRQIDLETAALNKATAAQMLAIAAKHDDIDASKKQQKAIADAKAAKESDEASNKSLIDSLTIQNESIGQSKKQMDLATASRKNATDAQKIAIAAAHDEIKVNLAAQKVKDDAKAKRKEDVTTSKEMVDSLILQAEAIGQTAKETALAAAVRSNATDEQKKEIAAIHDVILAKTAAKKVTDDALSAKKQELKTNEQMVKSLNRQVEIIGKTDRQVAITDASRRNATKGEMAAINVAYDRLELEESILQAEKDREIVAQYDPSTKLDILEEQYKKERELLAGNVQGLINIDKHYADEKIKISGTFWEKYAVNAQESLGTFDEIGAASLDRFTSGFGNAIANAAFESDNLGDAMASIFKDVGKNMVAYFSEMAAQQAATWAFEKFISTEKKADKAAEVGTTLAAETTKSGIVVAAAVAERAALYPIRLAGATSIAVGAQAMALQASLAAFASTAAIPVVGPALAPAAAASAFSVAEPIAASIGSVAFAGAFDKGGRIPSGSAGIVAEYGNELVGGTMVYNGSQGSLGVTGREATAKQQGGNTNNSISVNSYGDASPKAIARALERMLRKPNKSVDNSVYDSMNRGRKNKGKRFVS